MKKLAVLLALVLLTTACGNRATVTEQEESTKGEIVTDNSGISGNPDNYELPISSDASEQFYEGDGVKIPQKWETENGTFYQRNYYGVLSTAGAVNPGEGISNNKPVEDGATVTPDAERIANARAMGYYVNDAKPDKSYVAVYVIDAATGEDMALCNRPNCTHASKDCVAYLPFPELETDPMFMYPRSSLSETLFLFAEGDNVYAFNGMSTVYRLSTDGSSRNEHMLLPDKYHYTQRNWLMHGKLYMEVYVQNPTPGGLNQNFSANALIEVDYHAKTVREIWQQEYKGDNEPLLLRDIIGFWDGKIYFSDVIYPPYDRSNPPTDDLIIDYTYSVLNPRTGVTEELFVFETGSHGLSLGRGKVLIHSNTEEALLELNLITKQKTILADNLKGKIQLDHQLTDGKLLIFRDNDILFYDFETEKIGEITIREKCNLGNNSASRILQISYDENDYHANEDYFYIYIESKWKEVESHHGEKYMTRDGMRLGKISKADYWNSNADAIEEMDWDETTEFMENLWSDSEFRVIAIG